MAVNEETGVVFAEDLPADATLEPIGPDLGFGVPEDSPVAKDPAEKAYEYERFVKKRARKPAEIARNIGYGVAGLSEGLFDPFFGLARALSTSGDVSRLMDVVRDPDAGDDRKRRALDNIKELEKLHLQDNRTYAGYRTIEEDSRKRAAKDPRVTNALNDLKAISSAFPMLVREMGRAVVSDNPEAARSLGLMLTADGVGSAVSVMDPRNFARNINVMPFSTGLSLVPVARIVAKSPALLAKFRGKYNRFDEFLDAVDDFDKGVRKGFEGIGDVRVGRAIEGVERGVAAGLKRIPVLRAIAPSIEAFGAGTVPAQTLRLGKQRAGRPKGDRVSRLRPEDRYKTLRDFGDKAIAGAKAGFLAGVPVEAGLVYAVGYGLFRNKLTRHKLAALDQYLRHTSAQAGASPELAARAIMMASARDRAEIRSQANKLAKLFEEGEGFAGPDGGTELAQSNRINTLAKYTNEEDSAIRNISLNELTQQIEGIRKSLADETLSPAERSRQEGLLSSLVKTAEGHAKTEAGGVVTLSTSVGSILDNLDALAQSRGISKAFGEKLRQRVADAAGHSALLLQSPEVSRQVVNVLTSRYGLPRQAAHKFIENYGYAYAKNPNALPSNKIVTSTPKGQGVVDLDVVVKETVGSMAPELQRRILGQVVSAEVSRTSGLVSNNAWNQAMRGEAAVGGLLERNLKLLGKDPDVFKASPQDYANALLMHMFRKDAQGDRRVPIVIPANVMGKNGADLSNAIRTAVITDDGIKALAKQAGIGDLTPAEVRNFRSSMIEVADRLGGYVDQSGDDAYRAQITRSLDAAGDLPESMRNLARKVNDDGVYVAPGFNETMSFHRGVAKSEGILGKLQSIFGLKRFKGMQTVYNPISHQNNIAGNLGLMMVRWGEDPLTFTKNAFSDSRYYLDFNANKLTPYSKMEKGSPEYYRRRAVGVQDQAGVANSDFVSGELMLMERAGLGESGIPPSEAARLRETITKVPRKLYSAEDNIPKLRFGMKYAQQFFEDVDNLSPGSTYEYKSSPVSTTTLFKGKDGKIYKQGKKSPLTDAELDNEAAKYTRRQVSEHFLAYNETSGLNRKINDSPFVSAVSPFFTFFHKAMGFGGTKGFLRNALEGTDGIKSNDPRIVRRQIKSQAEIAARRAYLINSFRQLTSREEDMLARAFAYNSQMPSSVVFEVLADGDTVAFRDLTSMNSFAPAEARMRASLYAIANIMKGSGLNKTPEQKKFLAEFDKGNIAGLPTVLELFGLSKGPMEQILDVARQSDERRKPDPTMQQLLKVLLPVGASPVVALPLQEALSELGGAWETLSGVREVAGGPELSESRKDYFIRRFLGGTRRQGFIGESATEIAGKKKVTSQSLLKSRLKSIKAKASQLEKVLQASLARAKARRDKLSGTARDKANEEVELANERFLNERARVKRLVDEESLRLREAFEFVSKINRMRQERR